MSEFTYLIAVEADNAPVPEGYVERAIPPMTWAVFAGCGALPKSIQAVWKNIWSDFLPAGDYKHADGPDVEVYPPGDVSSPDYRFEVWVPVVKI